MLVSDDPNGMKTAFFLNRSLELVDDHDALLDTLDVFWFIDHYVSYCREPGLQVNKKLWVQKYGFFFRVWCTRSRPESSLVSSSSVQSNQGVLPFLD